MFSVDEIGSDAQAVTTNAVVTSATSSLLRGFSRRVDKLRSVDKPRWADSERSDKSWAQCFGQLL